MSTHPEDAPVLARYPLPGQHDSDRETRPWPPRTVVTVCGPDEWQILVEDPGSLQFIRINGTEGGNTPQAITAAGAMSHTGTAGLPNPENRSCPGFSEEGKGVALHAVTLALA